MSNYGKELILDLHNCDPDTFTRESIEEYFKQLCVLIDMERCDLHFWDYHGMGRKKYDALPSHLKGVSAVQFIMTSNIVIHTLDDLKKVFINIFTCKDLNINKASSFTVSWFKGTIVKTTFVERI